MKKTSALLSLTVVGFSALMFAQIATVPADAHTLPLTSPLTSPLTAFVAKISGKITIKKIKFFNFLITNQPAKNVTVKLTKLGSGAATMTTTDANGDYSFFLTSEGFYTVTPQISHSVADIVAPPLRFVTVKKHDKLHEDFQAIDLP